MNSLNSFGSAATLAAGGREYQIFALKALEKAGFDLKRVPPTRSRS